MKIAIIGLGRVGSAVAYALIQEYRNEVVNMFVYDINKDVYLGERRDLHEASLILNSGVMVCGKIPSAERIEDKIMDVLVFCAGTPRRRNESDDELYGYNKSVVESVFPKFRAKKIFMVTNPPEELAELTRKLCPNSEVIAVGEHVDDTRLKMGYTDSSHILSLKGFTSWGVVAEIMRRMKNESKG